MDTEKMIEIASELGIKSEVNSNNPGLFVGEEKMTAHELFGLNQARELNGLSILLHPHEILRQKCEAIKAADQEAIQKLIELRRWCMDENSGAAGIALPQVGIAKQGFVYYNYLTKAYDIAINPKFKKRGGIYFSSEGCLSIPDRNEVIRRYEEIEVIYQTTNMKFKQAKLFKRTAACFQHEYDHLHGKLYIDYLE